MILELDAETKSDVNLKTHGAYRYFESDKADVLFIWYKLDGSLKLWMPSEPCPNEIRAHVEAGRPIKAHNASFERLLWWTILTPRYGWPAPALEQFICTAATAAAMCLPRDLAGLGSALGLEVQKDKDGWRLINKFCIPRKPRKSEDPDGLYWNEPKDFPEDWEKFLAYGARDVETEAAADARMVPLSDDEQELYWIDQRINDRGIRIDRSSALAAIRLAEKAKYRLDKEMAEVTGRAVTACSQVAKLVEWVASRGVEMTSAAKADIEDLLECDDLPGDVRRAIELRQEAAKTSVSKLHAFLKRASDVDGRIRGAFLFHAAGTGRWSSVGAQLHNLPRPRKAFGDEHPDLRTLFDAFRSEDPALLKLLYGDDLGRPLHLISDAIRGFLWAAPGRELLVADYSGIEGAVAAWLAGEDWKVDAMFELIADPSLPDLYRRAAAGIFNTTTDLLTKKDPRRQVGKVSELSLQYQGGVGAFRSMARNYSLKIEPVYAPAWEAADEERQEKAADRYEECLTRNEPTTQVMSRKAWIAAELVKLGWRATHPAIVGSWKLLEAGVREAVDYPGRVVSVLKVKFVVRLGFLWCMLPSGRCLAYGKPSVRDMEVPWADKAQPPEKREKRPVVTALGVDSVTRKWSRFALYGGLIFENIVQAIARDLLAEGIRLAENAGYPVIGHVHDEILTEVLRGQGDVHAFEKLICQLPPWAAGLPLTASGWRGKRYRKD